MTRWQVFSAVALRRLPEVIPPKNAVEIKVQSIYDAYENAKSRYSSHELRHLEDIRLKNSGEADTIIKETAQDLDDKWTKEKSTFTFAEHNESLSRTNYLFMKIKFGSDIKEQWLLPQAEFNRSLGDENLLDTARRALKDSLNIINGYRIIGKIPASVYSFKYPKKIVDMTGHDGAKVFFMKANLDSPSKSVLEVLDGVTNEKLKWLTMDGALKLVKSNYMSKFSVGCLNENGVDIKKVLARASLYAQTLEKMRAKQ